MTTVHIDVRLPDFLTLVDSYIEFTPTSRIVGEDFVVLPQPYKVFTGDAASDIELEPSTAEWVWKVVERAPGGSRFYVEVPDSPTPVNYGELVVVDPLGYTPLDPLPPTAAEILADASAARDAAEAAAASVAPGQANGTATLDGGAKLPEAQVPTRLSEASLSNTIATVGAESFEGRRRRKLRRFWEKLAANNATVVIPGDSWTEGTRGADLPWLRYVDHLTRAIRAASGQAEGGIYIPSWATYPTRIPATWAFTGTTTQRDQTGMGFYNVEMAVGATATLTLRGTGFRMHMDRRTDGASVEVRIDGTLVETYNSQNATEDNGSFRTYGGYALGSHTIQLTVTAATGSVFSLQGAYVFNGDESSGVKVYPSGRGGITAKKFFETSRFAGQVGGTTADLVIFGLGGINDYRTGVTISEYLTAMRDGVEIITSRAPIADASLVFLQFPEPAPSGTPAATWDEFRDAVALVAEESGGLLVDLADLFTPGQLDGDSALVNVDEVHVDDAGHVAVAAKIAEAILPARTRDPLREERVFIPAKDFAAQDGTPTQGTVNGTWASAWRLPDGSSTSVLAFVSPPPGWGSCAVDVLVANYSTGTGNVRLRSRIGKISLGGSVSVANDDYKTHPVKGQYVQDRSWSHNASVTLSPDTLIRIMVAREGSDAADTLTNDLVFCGVYLRRLS